MSSVLYASASISDAGRDFGSGQYVPAVSDLKETVQKSSGDFGGR
ncbi:hypothetical protein [Streptomyces cirratus]|nr:hypothetical protein [Streptomyces cirratus]